MQNKTISIVVLLALLMSSCSSSKRDETTEITVNNLIHQHHIWEVAVDTFGSTFTTADPFINDERLKVDFTIATKEGDYFPYVEVKCFPDIDYQTLDKINISYICEHDVIIKLNQSDFSAGGDNSYAHYQFVLPKTDNQPNIATIYIDEFTQPQWAEESSRKIALNKENIEAIYLVPAIDYNKGESTTFTLLSLNLQ